MTAILAYIILLLAMIGATMPRFARACLGCKQLTNNGSYCDNCTALLRQRDAERQRRDPDRKEKKRTLYSPAYQKEARLVRATATTCHICGEGARLNDPWEADHLYPGNPTSPLLPAHRTCNRTKSNKQPTQTKHHTTSPQPPTPTSTTTPHPAPQQTTTEKNKQNKRLK